MDDLYALQYRSPPDANKTSTTLFAQYLPPKIEFLLKIPQNHKVHTQICDIVSTSTLKTTTNDFYWNFGINSINVLWILQGTFREALILQNIKFLQAYYYYFQQKNTCFCEAIHKSKIRALNTWPVTLFYSYLHYKVVHLFC